MSFAATILPELDHEMATTRSLLERVPDDKADWTPHPRSTPIGRLAMHLANLSGLGVRILELTEVDMNPPGGPPMKAPEFTSTADVLALFDENVAKARAAIAAASDDALQEPWSLRNAGHTIFTLPRAAVIRTMVLNHVIHHRGQLSVYLRLLDVPLPSIYGPTADTPM